MNEEKTPSGSAVVDDFESLKGIIDCLRPLDTDGQVRLLKSAITFLRLDPAFTTKDPLLQTAAASGETTRTPTHTSEFSHRTDISPKQFLLEKEPNSDIERVACLAYYLTHYRNMPEFKTLDISQLNTEAAQPKFSNASVPVDNARQRGFLVGASGGGKQLGALGEQFVQALPDREAAKKVLERVRVRKSRKKRGGVNPNTHSEGPNE